MPSKDVPSRTHHLRVSRCLEEVRLALQDISGSIIGEHQADDEVSRTHLHIWLEAESPRTGATAKKILSHLKLKGNEDWRIRPFPESDFEKWYEYVFKPENAKEILYNSTRQRTNIVRIAVAPTTPGTTEVRKSKQKFDAKQEFLEYCRLQIKPTDDKIELYEIASHYVDKKDKYYNKFQSRSVILYAWYHINVLNPSYQSYIKQQMVYDILDLFSNFKS